MGDGDGHHQCSVKCRLLVLCSADWVCCLKLKNTGRYITVKQKYLYGLKKEKDLTLKVFPFLKLRLLYQLKEFLIYSIPRNMY